MPRVSILLTCYNHIAYLPACVDSVRAQTYTDYELIAVDDGSTDGTREWLEEHLSEARLIFNHENLGTYGSLNAALGKAGGEFVAILNDDDLWAPEKLERQVHAMERFPEVGLVHTDGYFIGAEGERLQGTPLGFAFPKEEAGDALLGLIYQNKIIASAALVRRLCFEELGGFNEAFFGSGDWEMWLRLAEKWRIGFVAEPLTMYRVHGENASHKLERIWRDDEMLREWMRTRYWIYGEKRLEGYALKKALAHNEACLGTVKMLNGKPVEAREAYRNSLKMEPLRLKSYLRLWATYLPRSVFRWLK